MNLFSFAKYLQFSKHVRKPTKACQPGQSNGTGSQKTHTEYTQRQKSYSLMPQLC